MRAALHFHDHREQVVSGIDDSVGTALQPALPGRVVVIVAVKIVIFVVVIVDQCVANSASESIRLEQLMTRSPVLLPILPLQVRIRSPRKVPDRKAGALRKLTDSFWVSFQLLKRTMIQHNSYGHAIGDNHVLAADAVDIPGGNVKRRVVEN